MDWTVITGVADAAAALGVIGSLVFVGFQVRQNSAGFRNSAVQAHMAAYQELYSNVLNSADMAEIVWLGMRDPEQVEGSSRLRFFVFTAKIMRVYQGLHWQWRRRVLDDALFLSMTSLLEDLAVAPGWRAVWHARRHQFDPEFQAFMDGLITEAAGRPLFSGFAGKDG
jgi:hypothetical protein